jgi:hypothetical protein
MFIIVTVVDNIKDLIATNVFIGKWPATRDDCMIGKEVVGKTNIKI